MGFRTAFQRYLTPGLTLMSIVVGGGYATGREFASFFLSQGPAGGLVSIAVAAALFGVVFAASLEFARVFGAYDYRTFFRALLGPFWVLFEISYIALLILVLAVISATCGALAQSILGAPQSAGIAVYFAATIALAFFGSAILERFLVFWSIALYVFYGALVILCLAALTGEAQNQFAASPPIDLGAAVLGGFKYAGYNISTIAGALFVAVHLHTARQTVTSGLLGGALAMAPGVLLYISMVAFYPAILEEETPISTILARLDLDWFKYAFLLVVFSTLISTAAALLHALNERIANADLTRGRGLGRGVRAGLAAGVLVFAVIVAERIGLIALVEHGYGLITFAFIAIYLIPIVTLGVWKIVRRSKAGAAAQHAGLASATQESAGPRGGDGAAA